MSAYEASLGQRDTFQTHSTAYGFNSGYESVKTHILSMDPLPPINKALGLLQKIEKQKMLSDAQSDILVDATAYASTRTDSRRSFAPISKKPGVDREDKEGRECTHCLRKGHNVEECFKLKTCTFCNTKGHIKEHCYKLKALNAKAGRTSGGYKRNANNVDVLGFSTKQTAHDNTPMDDYSTPSHVSAQKSASSQSDLHNVMRSEVVQGIVNSVISQVLQAIHDRTPSTDDKSYDPIHSAGPFK
ncbi:hypothetical protein RND81_08G071400 [Saponaria officinalis]|uniref:Uncharacterized protein n=1 Tax=Saponaria officinalis TaxID=3572 RepID=A0AAW1J4J1_SAPOF